MLKRFEVTNFKNFKESVSIDFGSVGGYQFNADCIKDDTVSKMLLYGKNGTGKTNLGIAVMDIARACAYSSQGNQDAVYSGLCNGNGAVLNADSDSDTVKFDYLFSFDGMEVQYTYSRDAVGVYCTETLYVDSAKIFDFDYANRWFWHGNLELLAAETAAVERFLEGIAGEETEVTIPFLRWIFFNSVFDKDTVMVKFRNFVDGMRSVFGPVKSAGQSAANAVLRNLQGEKLAQLEAFLNAMGVECKLENSCLPDGTNALYFKHKKLLPFFEAASAGTLALYDLYCQIAEKLQNLSFVYLDGIDAGFHYETAEKFFMWLKESCPDCQIMLTTHNTHLMTNRLTRPDCVCILTPDGKVQPLNKAYTREIREGYNLEKLYMSGEFGE